MEETNVQQTVNAPVDPKVMISQEQQTAWLLAEIERLKAEVKASKDLRRRGLSMKVSEKGALSIYGLGRFPVTLYKSQILALGELFSDGTIAKFVEEHTGTGAGMLKEREDRQ